MVYGNSKSEDDVIYYYCDYCKQKVLQRDLIYYRPFGGGLNWYCSKECKNKLKGDV